MARLIDADLLMEKLNVFNDREHGNEHFINGIETAKELLEDMPTTTESEIRAKVIDEAMEKLAEEICVGCGSLKDRKCTYKGSNCRVSKIMLEKTMKVLEQLKGE